MSLNTTPRTWVAGPGPSSIVTAAQLNTEIRDALTGIQAAWTSDARASTSIWTASTSNPALGNGTLVSRYRQIGKTWDWEVVITMGTTTTFGTGTWQLVPPFTPLTQNGEYPVGAMLDNSAPARFGMWAIKGTLFSLQASVTAGNLSSVNSTTPMTWANGDILSFLVTGCEGV